MAITPSDSKYALVNENHLTPNVSLSYQHTTYASTANVSIPPDDSSPWSSEFSVTLATVLSISAFLTIVGNIMVLMVIIRHRGMRTRTNLFLVNLAIADLLVGLVVLPFPITTLIQGRWIFGEGTVCSLNTWMNAFCLVTSIHTLMYIGIHKFFSIVRPLNNPLKLHHIICMMAAAWIWGATCATFAVLGIKVQYKRGTSQCGPKYPTEWKQFIFHGLFQTTVVVIPFIILVYCYVRMFREIKRHSERLRNNSTVEEDFLITQQKKVTITLFIVLTCFVMMVLPYHIYATYTTIKKDKTKFPSFINPLAYMFVNLSSMCNPIIYAFRSPAFREGYKEILCQTPNYVISDESEPRRPSRFSIFNFRRSSRPSDSNVTSVLDSESALFTPIPPSPAHSIMSSTSTSKWLPNNNNKNKKNYKKSLVSLVRSTRQSNASSVIHRNGETIIIKGGKIVSVRRPSDRDSIISLSSREPPRPLMEMAKSVAETANSTVCGIALVSGIPEEEEERGGQNERGEETAPKNGGIPYNRSTSNKSETEIIFEEMDSELAELDDSNVFENNEGNDVFAVIPECEIPSGSEHSLDEKSKQSKHHSVRRGPKIEIHEVESASQSSLDQKAPSASPHPSSALSKMIRSIAGNMDILVGTPLSPRTKNGLTKSDINLSSPPASSKKQGSNVVDLLALSRSTENLDPRTAARRLKRLPSMEYLDPPVQLFRTRSHGGFHHKTRAKSPSPSPMLGRINLLKVGTPANV